MKKPQDQTNAWLRFLEKKAELLAITFEEANKEIHEKANAGIPYGEILKEYYPLRGEALSATVEPGSPCETVASGNEFLSAIRVLIDLRDGGEGGAGQGNYPTGDLGPTMTPPKSKPKDMDK
jgi:hypothetical protein